MTQFEHRYILADQDHGGVHLDESNAGWERLEEFLDVMDEHEDVTAVYHNAYE